MTNRMQFTVTGIKALPDEVEITIHDLTVFSRKKLRYLQKYRVIHAVSYRLIAPTICGYMEFKNTPIKAVIEIEGVFQN